MKKITIIFGGNVGIYLYVFKTLKAIEDSLKCKIKRTGHFSFRTKIKEDLVDILFCYGPIKNKNYLKRKELFALNEKEIIPPPASKILGKINKGSLVLLLGLCGGLKGKKSDIYLPEEFNEMLFKESFINKNEILQFRNFRKIVISNFLKGKLLGNKARMLTSDLTFQPKSTEGENTEILLDIIDTLSKKIDAIDKESYQIAKGINDKFPLGVMLMASDILNNQRFMLKGNFKPNINKFNRNCVNAIKIALKK